MEILLIPLMLIAWLLYRIGNELHKVNIVLLSFMNQEQLDALDKNIEEIDS